MSIAMPPWVINRVIPVLALLLYGITAWISKGYYHYDEHYQIIEFAFFKMGLSDVKTLAWEYQAGIRSGIQPFIAFVVFRSCYVLNIQDPYILAFVLRLLSVMLILPCKYFFYKVSVKSVPAGNGPRLFFLLATFFIWFFPYLSVRFSAENWSAMCLLMTVSLLMAGYSEEKNKQRSLIYASAFFLGLSFTIRFQSAFCVLGVIAWMLFVKREKGREMLIYISILIIPLLLEVLTDRWLYNKFVFAAYQYFLVNIVHDKASEFGTMTVLSYLWMLFSDMGWGVAVFAMLGLAILCIDYKNILLWIIVPFIIGHLIVPHKETRFMFPLMHFIPYLLLTAIVFLEKQKGFFATKGAVLLMVVFGIYNFIASTCLTRKLPGASDKDLTYYIHRNCNAEEVYLIFENNCHPYDPIWELGVKENFYAEKNIRYYTLDLVLDYLNIDVFKNKHIVLVATPDKLKDYNTTQLIKQLGLHKTMEIQPVLYSDKMLLYDNLKP
jgi:phosphatidylinositol glycan class B